MTKKQKWSVIMVLVCVWAFSIIAPAFIQSYKPPPELHSAFPVIIGALLAVKAKDGDDDDDDDDNVPQRQVGGGGR